MGYVDGNFERFYIAVFENVYGTSGVISVVFDIYIFILLGSFSTLALHYQGSPTYLLKLHMLETGIRRLKLFIIVHCIEIG
jgi:hypothetical protein